MKYRTKYIVRGFILFMIAGVSLMILARCSGENDEGKVIVLLSANDGNSTSSVLAILDITDPAKEPIPLTQEFAEIGSFEISYHGDRVLFDARKQVTDVWQIFEMDLEEGEVRAITAADSDSRDPAFLPGQRMVFSRMLSDEHWGEYHVLMTASIDGSDQRQITFEPMDHRNPSVLNDGRLIVSRKTLAGEQNAPRLWVMRPDGTKSDVFYGKSRGYNAISRTWETTDGHIVFVERNQKGRLVRISYGNPQSESDPIMTGSSGDFISISPSETSEYLVCLRKEGERSSALYALDAGEKDPVNPIYMNDSYDVTQVMELRTRQRPRNLPSAVNPEVATALLMCQDANYAGLSSEAISESTDQATHQPATRQPATRIEVLGKSGSLGIYDLEADGSFYLKIQADMPFRLQTVNELGEIVSGPGSWMNLRPNERRACVGCHTGSNEAPSNRQPLAVQKDPLEVIVKNSEILASASK